MQFPPADKKTQAKVACYKTANLAALPDFIKKSIATKLNIIDEEEKSMEGLRRTRVESRTVQLLKFAQTKDSGKGTISFD